MGTDVLDTRVISSESGPGSDTCNGKFGSGNSRTRPKTEPLTSLSLMPYFKGLFNDLFITLEGCKGNIVVMNFRLSKGVAK